jgi:hypothetical protein
MLRYILSATLGFTIVGLGIMPAFPIWQAWIYEFQTLITGLAAVGAATGTAWVMIKTDAAQDRRHQETVSLSLRPDRLRVERMLFPGVALFTDQAIFLQKQLDALVSCSEDELHEFFNWPEGKKVIDAVADIRANLGNGGFNEARNLFDAKVDYAYVNLWELFSRLGDTITHLSQGTRATANGRRIDFAADFREQMADAVRDLRALHRAFGKMAAEYKLQL